MPARWLDPAEAAAAARAWADPLGGYLAALVEEGPLPYVANAPCRVHLLEADGALLPVTAPDPDAPSPPEDPAESPSYVVSPLAHFARYPREELGKLPSPLLRSALGGGLAAAERALARRGFERTVFVNNALLSTNLWPAVAPAALADVLRLVRERFPGHAVAFRSLDALGSRALLAALVGLGGRAVPARVVYYQDARRPDALGARSAVRKDLRLLRRTPYRLVDPPPEAAPRAAELYGRLYREKYARLNPAFTPRFFERAIGEGWLRVRGFVADGRLDAVYGAFVRNGLMTQPLFGYDTALPQRDGLYRLLSAQKLLDAAAAGVRVHASAGAGAFKAARGGVPTPEFLVVFDRHLPASQRRAWAVVAALGRWVGLPLVHRYGL